MNDKLFDINRTLTKTLQENQYPDSDLLKDLLGSTYRLGKLNDHLNKVSRLPTGYSAYRPFYNTKTALLKLQSDILLSMGDQEIDLLSWLILAVHST